SQLVRKIAQAMKPRDRKWIEGIRVSAQLHDIGKICVPAEILSHPGKLGREQFELIKLHSETGYKILSNIEFTFGFPFTNAILQHHERLDGTGYPNGLSGSEIILEARILAVADVMEAMVNHRPYRAGLGITCALDEITKNAGSKYDQAVVESCRGIFLEDKFEFREVFSAP
ncbi:MAG TPA: HD domain-containing phosphohydrolase, partial [Spirochaetota bacterium]|nr:HD domain-containing phosphohydrolase [Spirochaetota bacterium]